MTSIRAGRAQVGALRGSRTAPAARAVLMEALNRALLEPVRFRTPDREFPALAPVDTEAVAATPSSA